MNAWNGLNRNRCGWRSGVLILAGAFVLMATAVAEEKAAAGTSSEDGKVAPRISPHVLAAQRRLQQGEASAPRVGLQSQMQRQAMRRHVAPTRLGT